MTAYHFNRWLAKMGFSDMQAAEALGAHRNSIRAWRRDGAPNYVAIACTAIDRPRPLKPWRHTSSSPQPRAENGTRLKVGT